MEEVTERTVFVDVERAGKRSSSPIIEFAALATVSGTFEEIARLEVRVEFDIKKADPKLLGLTKFSPTKWKYAVPEKHALQKLSCFLRAHATEERVSRSGETYRLARLAGHNAEFDSDALRRWFKRNGEFFPATRSPLDTVQLARWFFETNGALVPPPDYKLSTLAEYFSLRTKPDHTALHDARASLELARLIAHYSRVGVCTEAA